MKTDKTNAQVFIDYFHHKVHHEKLFLFSDSEASVLHASPFVYLLKTPNGAPYCHVNFDAEADALTTVSIYEAPTYSAPGTGITGQNFNRGSANTPSLLVYKTPTVSINGTLLLAQFVGGSTGNISKIGGGSPIQTEWDLKPNTTYLVIFTPAISANIIHNVIEYEIDSEGN